MAEHTITFGDGTLRIWWDEDAKGNPVLVVSQAFERLPAGQCSADYPIAELREMPVLARWVFSTRQSMQAVIDCVLHGAQEYDLVRVCGQDLPEAHHG